MSTKVNTSDTIAALATPAGIGGIAVIRISGKNSFSVCDTIFCGSKKIVDALPNTIHYGTIKDPITSVDVDTVLVSKFQNPHSYTGDDVIEISSHGGYFVAQAILKLLYRNNIRPANPGEFTLRAFLNGKMDLTQAEAIADLIHSKTERSHRNSIEQLHGHVATLAKTLRKEIIDNCSLLELELDFSQEDIELVDKNILLQKLRLLENKIERIINSYNSGRFIREGIKVTLIGKPNAGKSSLLNILLEEERAIVSDIPGTTRDTIEESIIIDGFEYILTDTAGLRESGDIIEQEGIRRTHNSVKNTDIAMLVVDSSEEASKIDSELYERVNVHLPAAAMQIIVINKTDIKNPKFSDLFFHAELPRIEISCKSGTGINALKKVLNSFAIQNFDSASSSFHLNNLRHKVAFENALQSIEMSIESLTNGMSDDFIAVDLRRAGDYLGEIIGITTPDDILNNIFGNFCIGK